jgi:CBS domain-containing protein
MMQRKLVTVRPEQDLQEAVRLLLRKGYSGAPVVDAEHRLVGVLSEHDCIRVMSQAVAEGWPGGHVEHLMTREVETVGPAEDALSISTRFTQGHHRRLLVVEDGRLVGLISRRDLMKALEKVERAAGGARDKSTYDAIAERHRTLD